MSIVDHNSQESVSRALLKKFCPLTGPGQGRGPDEHFPMSATRTLVMSSAGRWSLQNANFIRHVFQAERLGLRALAVIVVSTFLRRRCRGVPRASLARTVRDDSTTKCRRRRADTSNESGVLDDVSVIVDEGSTVFNVTQDSEPRFLWIDT